MAFYKNQASQKFPFVLVDTTSDNAPVTGEAANITAQISINGGALASTNDTNPTEVGSSGLYLFDATQAETNGDFLFIVPSHATYAFDPPFLLIFTTPGSSTALDANAVQVSGDQTAADTLELFAEALDQATGQLDSGSFANNWLTAAGISADAGAEIAALVETYIINEGDATATLQAIADRIAADWVAGDASPLSIVAALKADTQWQALDYDNAIWVDPDGGTDDATNGSYGKRSAPCKTWANVASLLTARSLNKVRVVGSGNLLMTSMPVDDLTIVMDPHCTIRTSGTVTTGIGSRLEVIGGADFLIGGTWTIGSAGILRIRDCRNVTGTIAGSGDSRFEAENSEITGTLTLSNFGEHQITKCWSIHTSTGYPTVAVTTGHCTITDWEGGLTVNPTGTGHIHITGRSTDLTIAGSSGSVELTGEIIYTNSGTGTLTVDSSGVTARDATQIKKGTSYRYTNDASGVGTDDVTIDDVP